MKAHVLIVDDDAQLRRALADRFSFWGHAPAEAADGLSALEAAAKREFDLVLLDLQMPGMSGLEVLRQLRDGGCSADIVMLTAHGSVEAAVEALKLGASDFLLKPADFDMLQAVVERALETRSLQRVNRALEERIAGPGAGFVQGESPAMRELLETGTRAAQSNATVLLNGESGSGKQVLAEFIHRRSPRAAGPFVYVNCVALSDELIESTLFGHEKGAFTGAVARKEGRLEAAAGGTAFLDEVGDISPRLQTKLLHFLETHEFERVGGTRTLSVDARIVAATNRDLDAEVKAGRFREDLYFRLNVIRLRVPPLRERPEDIAPLARRFLERYVSELRRGPLKFAVRTEQILRSYAWPGNVRQLKNAVERMAVLARTDTLTPDLLPPEVFAAGADPDAPPATAAPGGVLPLHDAVLQFKKEHIARALAQCGGNQTRAAELLGLQRTFLNRLIKELGL
ncbi:MAG: sigma-54-dependent Fis family transcriptional regulator [Candidatus Eisenbacteria bacterium]|nr:sigma-54-dependent Fis family transcriptional regulator [Candidatus Eisenbacteria bacterium]